MIPVRYSALALVAVVLTVTCPGDTVLWHEATQLYLLAILIAFVMTVGGMLYVHRSDPGYISAEMMASFDGDDMSLLGDATARGADYLGKGPDIAEDDGTTITTSENGSPPPHRRRSPHLVLPRGDATTASTHFPPSAPPDADTSQHLVFTNTRRKVCEVCQLAPPLRSHHCKICQRCVATYDHHCPLVGTCIGERNRVAFSWFLLVQAASFALLCHIMGSSRLGVGTLLSTTATNVESMDAARVLISKLYLYCLTTAAYCMLGIHTCLIMGNITTFEFIKGPRHLEYLRGTRDMDLPFSRGGCIGNVGRLCCSNNNNGGPSWKPTLWSPPGKIVRDSEDWWEHPWQNKYWSCC